MTIFQHSFVNIGWTIHKAEYIWRREVWKFKENIRVQPITKTLYNV